MQPTFLIKKKITISNEYVYSKNKHKVSETHGQSKIKFSKKDFLEIFGENMTGKIFYNKNNIINFLNLVLERWKQIFFYNIENFKNPNLIKINSKIEEFKKKYKDNLETISENYNFTLYRQGDKALETWIFKNIIYYVAIPFETYIEIIKSNFNDIYISFGVDYSLIKNSILFKTNNLKVDSKKVTKGRIGQDKLRDYLLSNFKKCQITELENPDIIIASHIKPWAYCNDKEQIDKNNVLLLSSTFDKLFDKGLMSFDTKGNIIFSDILSSQDIFKLKRSIINLKIEFNNIQNKYLEYHRNTIFRVINGSIHLKQI